MSTLSQFIGINAVAASLNNGAPLSLNIQSVVGAANANAVLSGVMTAGALKTALSVSGRGQLNWLALYRTTTLSKSMRTKLTLDGVVVYDKTDAVGASLGVGFPVVGAVFPSGASITFQPLRYRTSLLIEFASSVAETDGISVAWNLEVHQ
jgi:hypothetical protein